MAGRMQDQIFAAAVIVTWLTVFGVAVTRAIGW
jgi:hypothetical protein